MKTLELGVVIRPHGIRGELKVKLHFEQSDTLFEVQQILLRQRSGELRVFEISGARRQQKGVLLRLKGVDSREAAESLRGAEIAVDRELLDDLGPDEYYLVDLVGCRVESPEGHIGVVKEIQTHPTVDSLVIQTPDGSVLEQPIAEPWLESVSLDQRIVVLSNRDGLIGRD